VTETPGSIRILSGVLAAMVAHARREAPNESCGLLVGSSTTIDECVPTTNLAASPTRFRVDPAEHIALNRRLRGSPRTIVGAYHSHPGSPAEPSPTDLIEAHYPEFVYVIVSLAGGREDVRAYRIRDAQAKAIEIRPD
jgi:[CysO sulfur-carrier protein]-S-L-cysteine hydrolase